MTYDIIIVGAGSSGLMASIHASMNGQRVLLIDKNPRPGRKLVLSGGGRCNVTNRTTREGLIQHIPGNGKFLYSALYQFGPDDIIQFFESRNVPLKEEDHGRMFPTTDRARTILDCLVQTLSNQHVDLLLKTTVKALAIDHHQLTGVILEDGTQIHSTRVILACGGRTYPRTGSNGAGYRLAKQAGHTITTLYPTEVPLLSHDPFLKKDRLRGLSLRDIDVTLWKDQIGGKALAHHRLDMIFTHQGYSGPAILRLSGHVNQWLMKSEQTQAIMSINLAPDLDYNQFEAHCEQLINKELRTLLKSWVPERLADVMIEQMTLDGTMRVQQMTAQDKQIVFKQLTAFKITAYGSLPLEKGFVTGGGVSTKEVNPKSMESKILPGLYFCGELLDINGYTGGYNITAAFVTGAVAGTHASQNVLLP